MKTRGRSGRRTPPGGAGAKVRSPSSRASSASSALRSFGRADRSDGVRAGSGSAVVVGGDGQSLQSATSRPRALRAGNGEMVRCTNHLGGHGRSWRPCRGSRGHEGWTPVGCAAVRRILLPPWCGRTRWRFPADGVGVDLERIRRFASCGEDVASGVVPTAPTRCRVRTPSGKGSGRHPAAPGPLEGGPAGVPRDQQHSLPSSIRRRALDLSTVQHGADLLPGQVPVQGARPRSTSTILPPRGGVKGHANRSRSRRVDDQGQPPKHFRPVGHRLARPRPCGGHPGTVDVGEPRRGWPSRLSVRSPSPRRSSG